jgi:hypothetical protein
MMVYDDKCWGPFRNSWFDDDGLMKRFSFVQFFFQQDLDSRWGINGQLILQTSWHIMTKGTRQDEVSWFTGFPAVSTPFHGYLLFCPCVVLSWMPIWKVSGFKIGTFQYIISYYTIYVLQIQSPCHHVHAYTPCHVLDGYCCGKGAGWGGRSAKEITELGRLYLRIKLSLNISCSNPMNMYI